MLNIPSDVSIKSLLLSVVLAIVYLVSSYVAASSIVGIISVRLPAILVSKKLLSCT